MLEETLTAKLKTITPQVYPVKAPEDAQGAQLIYQLVGADRLTHLDGPGGLAIMDFRVDCYDLTYAETVTLARAVLTACNGWKEGPVLYCSVDNDIDFGAEADEDGYYRRSMELRITYLES